MSNSGDLLSQSQQDMSTEESKSVDLTTAAVKSIKTGFGSIIGIFGKDEQKKKA